MAKGVCMRSMRFPVLAIMLLLGASAAQADETVSVKLGYQDMAISGQFAGTVGGVGSTIDVKNDLNFKRSDNVTGELALQLGDERLSFGYLPLDFKGSGTLARNISYNGQNYAAGTAVTSRIKATIYDFAVTHYLINMNDMPSRFQLGIEPALKIVHAESSLTAAGATNQVSASVPIPTMGLRARVALADFVGIVGRVGYMAYANNHFLDADGQVEFSPVPLLGIYAGYRRLDVKIDNAGAYVSLQMAGPYAGAFFRF